MSKAYEPADVISRSDAATGPDTSSRTRQKHQMRLDNVGGAVKLILCILKLTAHLFMQGLTHSFQLCELGDWVRVFGGCATENQTQENRTHLARTSTTTLRSNSTNFYKSSNSKAKTGHLDESNNEGDALLLSRFFVDFKTSPVFSSAHFKMPRSIRPIVKSLQLFVASSALMVHP